MGKFCNIIQQSKLFPVKIYKCCFLFWLPKARGRPPYYPRYKKNEPVSANENIPPTHSKYFLGVQIVNHFRITNSAGSHFGINFPLSGLVDIFFPSKMQIFQKKSHLIWKSRHTSRQVNGESQSPNSISHGIPIPPPPPMRRATRHPLAFPPVSDRFDLHSSAVWQCAISTPTPAEAGIQYFPRLGRPTGYFFGPNQQYLSIFWIKDNHLHLCFFITNVGCYRWSVSSSITHNFLRYFWLNLCLDMIWPRALASKSVGLGRWISGHLCDLASSLCVTKFSRYSFPWFRRFFLFSA